MNATPSSTLCRRLRWADGLAGVTAALLAVAPTRAAEQLYTVTARTTDLYARQQVVDRLYENQIVSGQPSPRDREWLQVTHNGKAYEAQRKDFLSNEDVAVMEARKLADYDNRLLALNQKIDALKSKMRQLFYASCAVRFDSAVQWRVPIYAQMVPGRGPGRDTVPPPVIVTPPPEDPAAAPAGTPTGGATISKGTVGKATTSSGTVGKATGTQPSTRTGARLDSAPGAVPSFPGGPVRSGLGPNMAVRYDYQNKITANQVNRLLKEFSQQFDETAKAAEKMMAERVALMKERVSFERANALRRERFEKYAADPTADYLVDGYIVSADRVAIYARQQVAGELPRDTVVTARPVLKDREWLMVWHQGKEYTAQAKWFRSRASLEEDAAIKQIVGTQQITDLEDAITDLNENAKTLGIIHLPLSVDNSGSYVVLQRYPFAADFPGRVLYVIPACNSPEGTEVLDASRARRLARDIANDIKDVQQQADAMRKKAGDWKKEVAVAGPKLQNQLRRLEQAMPRTAGPALAPVPGRGERPAAP